MEDIDTKQSKKIGLVINILIPIFLGAIIYYFISPEVMFVKIIDSGLGLKRYFGIWTSDNLIFIFIRNYFLDMLWAYALVISLFLIIGNEKECVFSVFLIAFSFSIILELLQIIPFVRGTFDLFDIAVEFLTEGFAVIIIKKYFLEESGK